MQLVFVTIENAANVHGFRIGHTKPTENLLLRRHNVQTRYSKNGSDRVLNIEQIFILFFIRLYIWISRLSTKRSRTLCCFGRSSHRPIPNQTIRHMYQTSLCTLHVLHFFRLTHLAPNLIVHLEIELTQPKSY